MKVKCITDGFPCLTKDNIYTVIKEYSTDIGIKNDDNHEHVYSMEYFEIIPEEKTITVTLTLPAIEGYEYIGEYRHSVGDEPYMVNGHLCSTVGGSHHLHHILKKIAPKYVAIYSTEEQKAIGQTDLVGMNALEDALEIIRSAGLCKDHLHTQTYLNLKELINQ